MKILLSFPGGVQVNYPSGPWLFENTQNTVNQRKPILAIVFRYD